ncbi:MAG: CMP deaminase [Cytophagia bacterium]|nr:CMP deaminase [Cytophagia bacterium]NBW36115.1 CMP deaminase [Cytophagia bacterium]
MSKDLFYMQIAEIVSEQSKCKRAQVGAILVKEGNVIAIGYNGTPSGFCNDCESQDVTLPEVLHAESNAIAKCARSTSSADGSTLYTTLSPCFECCKLIIQAGISRVVYKELYRDYHRCEYLLDMCNITIESI